MSQNAVALWNCGHALSPCALWQNSDPSCLLACAMGLQAAFSPSPGSPVQRMWIASECGLVFEMQHLHAPS